MPPVGFDPTISAAERPQTYALDHAATGTGLFTAHFYKINYNFNVCLHKGHRQRV